MKERVIGSSVSAHGRGRAAQKGRGLSPEGEKAIGREERRSQPRSAPKQQPKHIMRAPVVAASNAATIRGTRPHRHMAKSVQAYDGNAAATNLDAAWLARGR
jgi:hypothetical protein